MSRNQKNELQQGSTESAKRPNEASEARDSATKLPASESDDTKPAERPDLDWAEHED
jgi:hypothetical protein